MKKLILFFGLSLLLVSCQPANINPPELAIAPTEIQAEAPLTDYEERISQLEVSLPNLPRDASNVVSSSGNCTRCHTGITAPDGEDISFDTLWRSTMMAQAARDPYWLATVSSEIAQEPELSAIIQDKCAKCHMPLAYFDAELYGRETLIFGETGFLNKNNALHNLAVEGVSCNLCHQIEPDNLGRPESFSGGYLLNTTDVEWGGRVSYGPFETSEPVQLMMSQFSGYLPVQSDHMTESALCGTCHNLYTPFLNADDEIAGEFPEQMTFTEWNESRFADTDTTCQSCHMPLVEGPLEISAVLGVEGPYVRKHTFTGSNVYMLTMLAENREALEVTATYDQMQQAIDRVTEHMENDAGVVALSAIQRSTGQLSFDAQVFNLAGHKFPSGYPSRRLWLHVIVRDEAGTVIFESGAVSTDGKIAGNDNDINGSLYEPHYTVITEPQQVQIYEAIMQNTEGDVTTTLLRGAAYLKDNRLLPNGMALTVANPDIAPYGLVLADADFGSGTDTITYQIDVSGITGSLSIEVELLYQSIGYRWAERLQDVQTDEVAQFGSYYDALENWPIVIAQAAGVAE